MGKRPKSSKSTNLEQGFDTLWKSIAKGHRQPVKEYRFAVSAVDQGARLECLYSAKTLKPREWRFDRCWPEELLAVEIDGGIFVGGSHNRGLQFSGDCEKINAAIELNWAVLRYTVIDLRQKPVQMIEQICRVLTARQGFGQKYQRQAALPLTGDATGAW